MEHIDIAAQATILENLKATLITELSTLAVYHPATDDWEARFDDDDIMVADDNTVGDHAESVEEKIATLALLETRYRNVVRALHKIADGTYGVCEISGEPIESARLMANPAARTCVAHREDEVDLPL